MKAVTLILVFNLLILFVNDVIDQDTGSKISVPEHSTHGTTQGQFFSQKQIVISAGTVWAPTQGIDDINNPYYRLGENNEIEIVTLNKNL